MSAEFSEGNMPEPTMKEPLPWTSNQEILQLDDRATAFRADNHSTDADRGRKEWFDTYGEKGAIIAMFCADARERFAVPPDRIIDVSTIAASGPAEPYAKMLTYPRTRAVVGANHYDGDKFDPAKFSSGESSTLIGCGGLGAKAEIENGKPDKKPSGGILKYVDEDIQDKDAVFNSIKNGAFAAALTHVPVLAGVHDHVYGTFTPVAYFNNGEGRHSMDSVVPVSDLLDPRRYDPKTLYGEGLPSLTEDSLPDVFKEFLEQQRQHIQQLQEAYPNLPEMLRVQNPNYLFITTEKVPTRIRYPHLLREPGSFFQVHIPRGKDASGIHIDNDAVDAAIEQAEYPVDHARFSQLHTIIIETGSLEQSSLIAKSLSAARRHIDENASHDHSDHDHEHTVGESNIPWIQDWLQRDPANQILIAQSNSGRTTQISKFTPNY
jgi:hypothetical protein